MAAKQPLKSTFDAEHVIRPIFTGGGVSINDDTHILATTLGEDVILTDPASSRHLARIEGDGDIISSQILTPSGSHLIVCSRSLSMRIFTLKLISDSRSIDWTLSKTLKAHSTPVTVLAVDRTSTLLGTGGTDGSIKVWDIAGGYITHTFRGPAVLVSALLFFEVNGQFEGAPKARSSQSRKLEHGDASAAIESDAFAKSFRLISGSQNGKVKVWDLNRKICVANLESHVSDVQGLDYSSTQHAVVTSSRDKTIIWWDTTSWKIRKVVPCLEMIEAVGFVDDGHLTYSAGSMGSLRIWDTDSGIEITSKQSSKSDEEAFVSAIYRPGLPFILAVQADHTLALYKPPHKTQSAPLPALVPFRRIFGTHDDIIDLAYLMPDSSLMALATNSEDIRLVSVREAAVDNGNTWDNSSALSFGQDVALLKGHEDIVISLDTDWSGQWIATGAKDNTAKLWRVDPEQDLYQCWATFSGHAESLGAVALPRTAPQPGTAARTDPVHYPPRFLITGSQDQTIKRWDVPRTLQKNSKSGSRAVFTRKAHDKDINALTIHHAGQLFASASQDKTVKIWSVEEGEVQGILRGHKRGVWSVQFAPLGLPALQGEDGPVTGKGVILTGSGDKSIKLWSLSDYTCVRTFEGHSNSVLKVIWLNMPDKAEQSKKKVQFASAGGDGLVKVWDASSGEVDCTLDNHEDRVWALAVHPDSNTIASGSGDSTVTFWKDTSSQTHAAASKASLAMIEQEQALQNHIHAGSYREAITLALQLNHPGRLLSLFTSVITTDRKDEGSLTGLKVVDEVLGSLSDDQIFILLLRLRDWNTNARTAPVAQRILWAVVHSYPAEKFSKLSIKGAKGQQSLEDVLKVLRVYTERHYRRTEELVDESFLVEYTLQEMDHLASTTGIGDAESLIEDNKGSSREIIMAGL